MAGIIKGIFEVVVQDIRLTTDNFLFRSTQTTDGTKAWDIFMSLVATTHKLGVSFFEYVRDRITEDENIESLATMIRNNTGVNLLGWSWQMESLPTPDY